MALPLQVACIILTALFLFCFSVAREPRGWRRLFQSMFSSSEGFSVNKNKVIDETLKKYGIGVAMVVLVIDVSIFIYGVTAPLREAEQRMSEEERRNLGEVQKIQGTQGSAGAKRAVSTQ
jgi:flagellar biosynthesis protein FlhB